MQTPSVAAVKVFREGSNVAINLAEVQVFADVDGQSVNVALASAGALPSQSSTYADSSDFQASIAIDGVTTHSHLSPHPHGYISHTKFSTNPWWQVTLDHLYPVTSVVVWNRQDCCTERLTGANIQLLATDGSVIAENTLGNTYNQIQITFALNDDVSLFGEMEISCLIIPKSELTNKFYLLVLSYT